MSKTNYTFSQFISDHKFQLSSSDIPEYFWYYLYSKLEEEIYDIGDVCELQLNADKTEVECVTTKILFASNGENIFIIDNAWTFEMDQAKSQLHEVDSLRERVAAMVGIDTEDTNKEDVIINIMDSLWKHVRYYDIKTQGMSESKKMWYLLDEVGTYIRHDLDNPTVRIVPFIYVPSGVCYSIAWLIRNVKAGDKLTVNRVEHIPASELRDSISYIYTNQLPPMPENGANQTLSPEFFLSHRSKETDPDLFVENLGKLDTNKKSFSVFTDVSFVQTSLESSDLFKLTDNREEADILWLFDHFKEFEQLSRQHPQTLVNQFPSEAVMTTKDLLAALGKDSDWLPATFNLKTELAEFVNLFHNEEAAFQRNQEGVEPEGDQKECVCNCHWLAVDCGVCDKEGGCAQSRASVAPVWIVKPWNMARGLGIFVTQSLPRILRAVEAFPTEPKIASRYVMDPVLFYRDDLGANVKFDLRYMVLLSSVEPARAHVSNVFWLRFANKQFVLGDWDDYETHFTVMNYKEGCNLKNITCDQFVPQFESQYPGQRWSAVEADIHGALARLMTDVTRREDPLRVRPSPQSRGMYAVDLMLEWDRDRGRMRPAVCEVNFCPDCTRAVAHHPAFFEDVFRTLFLDRPTNVVQIL